MKSFAKNKSYTIKNGFMTALYLKTLYKGSLNRAFLKRSINFSIEIWNNPRVIFYFYEINKPLKKYAE